MKRLILIFTFTFFYIVNYGQIPINGLVAWYPLNGNANDYSGNGNHGTLIGGLIWTENIKGTSNSSAYFNGTDSYITVPNSNSIQLATNELTFSLWFKGETTILGPLAFFSKNDKTNEIPQYSLNLNPLTSLRFGVTNQSNTLAYDTYSYPFVYNSWYYLALTWDGSSTKLYVNGNLIKTQTFSQSMKVDNHPLEIGRDTGGLIDYYKGIIDDIRIYNRSLSFEEINQLYNESTIDYKVYLNSQTVTKNDTFSIPVKFENLKNSAIHSSHIEINGLQGNFEYIELDTTQSLFGEKHWTTVINNQDSLVIISSAGADSISENGTLFNLRFKAIGDICSIKSINIKFAEFDNGEDSVRTENGIITITPAAVYGDIDENGRVNTYDASLILSTISLNATFDCQTKANADVTANGFVSALDAVGILMFDARLVTQFPVDSTAIGIVETKGLFAMESQIFNSTSEIIKVPVIAESFEDVFSYELTLQFSEAGLDFLGFEKSTFGNDSIYMNSDTDNGKIKLVMASVHELSGSGVLGNLLFKARELTSEKFVKIENMKLNESISKAGGSAQILTSIDDFKDKPTNYSLYQNYPNPFNPVTTISFDLPVNGEVEVSVFNLVGAKVGTVVQQNLPVGRHEFSFDASGLSSGVYFYQMRAGNFIQTRKLTVLK